MRRKDKEIVDEKVMVSIIGKAIICRVAMCWQDEPYVIPMNFGYQDNYIYLHSAREGRKLDILRNNNKVCIEFDADVELVKSQKACNTSMKYKSVLAFGKAVILKDIAEKKRALDIIMHHYCYHTSPSVFHYPEDALEKVIIIKVKIENMTGKEALMRPYEEKIKKYIKDNHIKAEYLSFETSCHSVEEAARTVNTSAEDFVKNICLVDKEGNLIVAIVKGEGRASTKKVGKALGIERPRTANPQEILEKTGFICGGVPSFGYMAIFLIDPKVMEKEVLYSGGGSEKSLIKISPQELQKANQGQVIRIRK